MLRLAELLSARPEPLWNLVKQCGVDTIAVTLNGGEQDQRMFQSVGCHVDADPESRNVPWSFASISRQVEQYAEYGFTVDVIEDTPPLDRVRLGLPGRDEQIDHIIEQIRAMSRLSIPTLCYNWMAKTSWARTSVATPARGGALVTGFRLADSSSLEPVAEPGEISTDQLWSSFEYYLRAVLPVAEEAGVRLALHPDDPPTQIVRNVPRIMISVEAFRKAIGLIDSPANAITLCQGNFALMTDDLPAVIKEFGAKGAIAFVHFRDVNGTAEDFVETFHDIGQTDLAACMRAYAEIGYDGAIRPDHVPTMWGEPNDRPGYATLGRLFALGYIRGLEQSAY